jgi:CHAP domain
MADPTLSCSTGIGEAAITCAASQVGVTEVGGNNCGPQVELFLAAVGLSRGFAWCAAFCYWCFRQAAVQMKMTNPCPRTGGGLRLWHLADPVCHVYEPARGRIYVLDHGNGNSHVGIVESVNDDGTITEISGNTNAAGSREGNAVARHTGKDPAAIHGGKLLGYLDMDQAVQNPEAA